MTLRQLRSYLEVYLKPFVIFYFRIEKNNDKGVTSSSGEGSIKELQVMLNIKLEIHQAIQRTWF